MVRILLREETIQEGLKRTSKHKTFVLKQSKHIGGSDYCIQSKRAVKSDKILPSPTPASE